MNLAPLKSEFERVTIFVGRRADALALTKLLQPFFEVEVWSVEREKLLGQEDSTAFSDTAILILDGIMLFRYSELVRARRQERDGRRLFTLLLLTAGRGNTWPEPRYRDCYDDVLQGPLDPSETVLRVRQLLDHHCASRENSRAVNEIRKSTKQLLLEKEKREEFIVTLSHDLRSPLTAARMGTERLLREMTLELRQTRTQRVLAALDRINNMIEDLLNAARFEKQKTFVQAKQIHRLRGIAEAALCDLVPVFGDRFIIDIPAQLEAYVQEDSIMRVLENLCSNAVKYGYQGAPIVVAGFLQNESVVLQVVNEGDRIAETPMSSLFDVFKQAPLDTSDSPVSGWGLGLAMVRAAAEAHGGTTCSFRDARHRNVFGIEIPSARANH